MTVARILIVEDEAIVAMDLQDRLESAGYDVVGVVDTADDAVRSAAVLRPDLVLMDIRIRGATDGVDAALQLRDRLRLPVIFLTAFADDATVARAKTSEPFGYLLKPFRERELHTAIQMALARADAERRLRQSERRYAATVNSIGDGVIAVDGGGRVTLLNPVAERLTGWTKEEAQGKPVEHVFVLVRAGTREGVENPATRALRENAVVTLPPDVLLLTRDGREVPVEDSAAPIRDDAGEVPPGAVLAFRDITERKIAESRLRQSQKLESLGILSGGLAHDFNNLLTPILGYAGLARAELGPESPAAPMLRHIEQAARRAGELSTQMLAYAGQSRLTRGPVDLSAVVREMGELLAHSLSKKAVLHQALADDLPAVEADAAQLRQVVLNLLTNASEALGDLAGTVLVRTLAIDANREQLGSPFCRDERPEGRYVVLEVADTGCGMDGETLAKIFDPFFTTKFQGRGLGLAAVLGIVNSHRGVVQVHSQPGHGTTFAIFLPASPRPVAEPTATEHEKAAPPWRGSGTVLIAEDESGVRQLAHTVLASAGFATVLAADGQEALDTFRARPDDFALILLDLTMPGLSGQEVLRAARQLRPSQPVLLMSGYSAEEVGDKVGDEAAVDVLTKPFAPGALLAKVRDILERKSD